MAERKNGAVMLVAAGIATVAGSSFMLGAAVVSILLAQDDEAGMHRAEAIAAPYITPKPEDLALAPVRAEATPPLTGAQAAQQVPREPQTQDAVALRISDAPVTPTSLALTAAAPASGQATGMTTGAQAAAPTGAAGEAGGPDAAPDQAEVGTEPPPLDDGSAALAAEPSPSNAAPGRQTDPATGDAARQPAAGASSGSAAQPAAPVEPRAAAALAALTPERYVVQVGAFLKEASAQRLVDRLDADFGPECPASVEQRPGRPGRVWWIVMLCPQPDLSAAGEMAGRVARSFDIRPLVRRVGAAQ